MRTIPSTLATRIESGAAELCHVWLLTRTDEVRLGFTDHDRELTVDGVVCSAASGWTAGAADQTLGFTAGAAAAAGALDSEAITEADIVAGLYDGCEVECRRVDWSDPTLSVTIWTGRIARLKREGGAFTAEVEGPLAVLDRTAGRTYGRLCDANLGDERCTAAGSHPDFGLGCDKRFGTCRDRFDNTLNFRGFPTIPGDDYLTAYPAEGERHDGSSRRG
jgi:hypothetical protein